MTPCGTSARGRVVSVDNSSAATDREIEVKALLDIVERQRAALIAVVSDLSCPIPQVESARGLALQALEIIAHEGIYRCQDCGVLAGWEGNLPADCLRCGSSHLIVRVATGIAGGAKDPPHGVVGESRTAPPYVMNPSPGRFALTPRGAWEWRPW